MPVEKNLLKLDDLIELSNLLIKNGFTNNDLTIVIEVHTDELMKKINEELYFKSRTEENNNEPINVNSVQEINVNIGDVKYKYVKT